MEQVIPSIIKKLELVKSKETDKKKVRQINTAIRELQKISGPDNFNKNKFLAVLEKLLPWIVIGEKCFRDIIHLWTSDK